MPLRWCSPTRPIPRGRCGRGFCWPRFTSRSRKSSATSTTRRDARSCASSRRPARRPCCSTATSAFGNRWRSSSTSPRNIPTRAIWPARKAARAQARAISNEMHAGFMPLRQHCPTNFPPRAEVSRTYARSSGERAPHRDYWAETRETFGSKKKPFLFGDFCAADAMFAPVVNRATSMTFRLAADARVHGRDHGAARMGRLAQGRREGEVARAEVRRFVTSPTKVTPTSRKGQAMSKTSWRRVLACIFVCTMIPVGAHAQGRLPTDAAERCADLVLAKAGRDTTPCEILSTFSTLRLFLRRFPTVGSRCAPRRRTSA